MKAFMLVFFVVLMCSCNPKEKQKPTELSSTAKTMPKGEPETFRYTEGDTTYVMQKYFMVFLKKGPKRDQDSITAAKIQTAHMAHLEKLHLEGKVCIAGPFEDESDVSGIVIFTTPTFKEADSLANLDPAVKAGRLTIETHPWWAAKGSVLK